MYKEVAIKQIISETEKAYLLLLPDKEEALWVPKSQTFGGANFGDELVSIRDWFCRQYNIITLD